jgi:hypothetical protein
VAMTRPWLLPPALICAGGLIASGNSMDAEAVGEARSLPGHPPSTTAESTAAYFARGLGFTGARSSSG